MHKSSRNLKTTSNNKTISFKSSQEGCLNPLSKFRISGEFWPIYYYLALAVFSNSSAMGLNQPVSQRCFNIKSGL